MATLRDLLNSKQDDENAKETRDESLAFQQKYAPNSDAPEEEGIHEDDWVPPAPTPPGTKLGMALPLNPVGEAAEAAEVGNLGKLQEAGPPIRWDQAAGPKNGTRFSKFIRGEAEAAPEVAPRGASEPLQVPRFGTSPEVKALQEERQVLNLKTPEGRARLKEIDGILSNRTYYQGK